MAKSIKKILLFLLAIASLTKTLRIRNGDKCLSCPSFVDILEGGVILLEPFINDPTRFYPCTPSYAVVPKERYWTYTPNKNYKINICVRTTNACLGVKLQANLKERRIDGKGVILESNITNSKQEWNYDGRKLTNVYMGPSYCAQVEEEFLMMVSCNATEPKQKIEFDNVGESTN